jgi:hypothetical protein
MNTLRLLIDICLFRAKPQDLPTSRQLLAMTVAAGVLVDVLSLPDGRLDPGRWLFILLQAGLFAAGVWLVLRSRGMTTRWTQTATALFAANAFFSLLLLPLMPALVEMMQAGPQAVPNWQAYVMLAVSGWFLAVMARVLREALETSMGLSLIITLALIFTVRMVGLLAAPLFGLHGEL